MTAIYSTCIRHPRLVLGLALAVVALAAPGLKRLRLRTDGHALVPHDAPAVLHDRAMRETFGIDDPIAVVIRSHHPDGIFNLSSLQLIQDLSDGLQRIEGLRPSGIVSLATERIDRVKPGTLNFQRALEPMPMTEQDLQRARREIMGVDIYVGTLISTDAAASAIYVGVPPGGDRVSIRKAVEAAVWGIAPSDADEIDVIGPPVAEMLLGTHILQDLGVPSVLLGASRSSDRTARLPQRGFERVREFVSRHVGLLPISLVVMVVIFWASFRRAAAGWLPLTKVGACLVFVLGLMGWCDVPIYLTITVMPVILTVAGMAGEIHILGRCGQLLRGTGVPLAGVNASTSGALSLVAAALDETWRPTLKSGITTGIGFLSFALSPLQPVVAFGIFTAVGIAFCMVWSLTVLPAVLTLLGPARFVSRGRDHDNSGAPRAGTIERIARPIVRHPHAVALVVLAISIVSVTGVRRITVQDSWIDGFAESSTFYQATRAFNERFAGTHVLLVCVDAGDERLAGEAPASAISLQSIRLSASVVGDPRRIVGWTIRLAPAESATGAPAWSARIESATIEGEDVVVTTARRSGPPSAVLRRGTAAQTVRYEIAPEPLMQPDVLTRIESLERFIGEQRAEAVGGVIGPARYLTTTNYLSRGRRETENRLPPDADRIAQAWKHFEILRGAERLRQVVDAHYSRGLITVFLKNANFVDTQRLLDAIRAYERAQLAPHGIALSFAGDVAVSQTLIDAIVTTQVRSLVTSLISVVLVAAVLGRSLGWGLYCAVPAGLAVLFNFAVMGWIGMPLGVATSMFAAMTLGIGDDYAIHFLERFRLLRQQGAALDQALTAAVASAGPPIVIDALAVALGFGTLVFSQVPANARLGGLVTLSLASCLAATLILLPALLRIWRPKALA